MPSAVCLFCQLLLIFFNLFADASAAAATDKTIFTQFHNFPIAWNVREYFFPRHYYVIFLLVLSNIPFVSLTNNCYCTSLWSSVIWRYLLLYKTTWTLAFTTKKELRKPQRRSRVEKWYFSAAATHALDIFVVLVLEHFMFIYAQNVRKVVSDSGEGTYGAALYMSVHVFNRRNTKPVNFLITLYYPRAQTAN